MKPTLEVTSDFTKDFHKIVAGFKKDSVLIGIPQDDKSRKDSDTVSNATLLALNNFGSQELGIPARPVMQIGIKNAAEPIVEEFKKAAIGAFTKGLPAIAQYYERAGIIASTSVKKAINAQEGIDPPSEATLSARRAAGFKGTKALIVTGQMRNAITYVVQSLWGR